MTRKCLSALALMAMLGLVLGWGHGVVAEESTSKEVSSEDPTEGKRDPITKILKGNEEILAGRGFTYDPAGRRDPFRSLVDPVNATQRGPRPQGIAGMLIGEVDLVGIVDKGRASVAFFNGSDNKGYFLKVGDALYDGKIVKINRDAGTVLFRQDVNDPRSIKPYRIVTKKLALAEEEGL